MMPVPTAAAALSPAPLTTGVPSRSPVRRAPSALIRALTTGDSVTSGTHSRGIRRADNISSDQVRRPTSKTEVPEDLLAAIEADSEAMEFYRTLSAQNRFALTFRTINLKTSAGRAKKIADFVAMLKRKETIYPQGRK